MSKPRPSRRAILLAPLLVAGLAGCERDSGTRVIPPPIERATAVVVVDSAGTPRPGVSVLATQLDGTLVFSDLTDAAGVARFTLAEGRWSVYAATELLSPAFAPRLVAGSTARVLGSVPGAGDTVLFRLRLGVRSFAAGRCTLAGRTDHRGTI